MSLVIENHWVAPLQPGKGWPLFHQRKERAPFPRNRKRALKACTPVRGNQPQFIPNRTTVLCRDWICGGEVFQGNRGRG